MASLALESIDSDDVEICWLISSHTSNKEAE